MITNHDPSEAAACAGPTQACVWYPIPRCTALLSREVAQSAQAAKKAEEQQQRDRFQELLQEILAMKTVPGGEEAAGGLGTLGIGGRALSLLHLTCCVLHYPFCVFFLFF